MITLSFRFLLTAVFFTLSLSAMEEKMKVPAFVDAQANIQQNNIHATHLYSVLTRYRVNCVSFNNKGSLVAGAYEDKVIRLVDVATGHCTRTLIGHTGEVFSACFNPEGTMIASAGENIRLWNIENGMCIRIFDNSCSRCLQFSPAGKTIAAASGNETRLWDVATGRLIRTLPDCCPVYAVRFSHNGGMLATATDSFAVKLYNVATGACLLTLNHGCTLDVDFSADGLLASASDDSSIKIWDVSDLAHSSCVHTLRGHGTTVRSVRFSPDGTKLISGSDDKTIKIWDVASGSCLYTLNAHNDTVYSTAFSPAGTYFASGSGTATDQTLKLWLLEQVR